jgi:uncharacterized C2H2 Zn-finger protein
MPVTVQHDTFLCPRCLEAFQADQTAWPECATLEGLVAIIDPGELTCPHCGLRITTRKDVYSCRVAGNHFVATGRKDHWPFAGGRAEILERAQ